MLRIIYIEDIRRPERNEEYKTIIYRLGFDKFILFCDNINIDYIANLTADGLICHSGMAGYDVVSYFSKKNNWPLLSYSGSVDSTPFLKENSFKKNHFSVDSDYFEIVLPEFIERCKIIKESDNK